MELLNFLVAHPSFSFALGCFLLLLAAILKGYDINN